MVRKLSTYGSIRLFYEVYAMGEYDIKVQDLREPDIWEPSKHNRQSFIRGWNEAVEGDRPGTVDSGEDNWRTVGWHAGREFGERDRAFKYQLFLWTANQRRLALGLPALEKLVD